MVSEKPHSLAEKSKPPGKNHPEVFTDPDKKNDLYNCRDDKTDPIFSNGLSFLCSFHFSYFSANINVKLISGKFFDNQQQNEKSCFLFVY